jgi:hypothetical protein
MMNPARPTGRGFFVVNPEKPAFQALESRANSRQPVRSAIFGFQRQLP